MSRTDPGVARYIAYWSGHGETVQSGVGMLFSSLRRGWPWVERVDGNVSPIFVPGSQPRGPRVAPPPPRVPSGISPDPERLSTETTSKETYRG